MASRKSELLRRWLDIRNTAALAAQKSEKIADRLETKKAIKAEDFKRMVEAVKESSKMDKAAQAAYKQFERLVLRKKKGKRGSGSSGASPMGN